MQTTSFFPRALRTIQTTCASALNQYRRLPRWVRAVIGFGISKLAGHFLPGIWEGVTALWAWIIN